LCLSVLSILVIGGGLLVNWENGDVNCFCWNNLIRYYRNLGIFICIGDILFIKFIFYLRGVGKLIVGWVCLFIKFKLGGIVGGAVGIVICFIYKGMYILCLIINKLLYQILGKLYKCYKLFEIYVIFVLVCYVLVMGSRVDTFIFLRGIWGIIGIGGRLLRKFLFR